jgi:hypothetical protein
LLVFIVGMNFYLHIIINIYIFFTNTTLWLFFILLPTQRYRGKSYIHHFQHHHQIQSKNNYSVLYVDVGLYYCITFHPPALRLLSVVVCAVVGQTVLRGLCSIPLSFSTILFTSPSSSAVNTHTRLLTNGRLSLTYIISKSTASSLRSTQFNTETVDSRHCLSKWVDITSEHHFQTSHPTHFQLLVIIVPRRSDCAYWMP